MYVYNMYMMHVMYNSLDVETLAITADISRQET